MKTAYDLARDEIGVTEWKDGHNPRVVKYFADVGHSWVRDDETAWCAAFVGAMLKRAGMAQTGKLAARSYMDWGDAVDLSQAKPGDVVVFWRENPASWKGHVGFFVRMDGDRVIVLGGNQGNKVGEAPYPRARLLGVRRSPHSIATGPSSPLTKGRESLAASTTMQAAAGAAVSGAGSAAYAVGQLDSTAQLVVAVGAVLAGLCLAWIMRERLRKWAGGDR